MLGWLKARTEEFLYLMLWTAEVLMRPTFRNLNESFEGWAYRNGLLRRIAFLEKERFLERHGQKDRIYRLTAKGRIHALGGRDPQVHWSRAWDGLWRLICFDVPVSKNHQRRRLRHYLRNLKFGLLQRSIWITPDAIAEQALLVRSANVEVKSLVLLEARPCGGESNAEIVMGAWDFSRVNRLYGRHLEILGERPRQKVRNDNQAKAILRWAQAEQSSWIDAVRSDPLLPRVLLPPGYLGEHAWRRRVKAIGSARRSIEGFRQDEWE